MDVQAFVMVLHYAIVNEIPNNFYELSVFKVEKYDPIFLMRHHSMMIMMEFK